MTAFRRLLTMTAALLAALPSHLGAVQATATHGPSYAAAVGKPLSTLWSPTWATAGQRITVTGRFTTHFDRAFVLTVTYGDRTSVVRRARTDRQGRFRVAYRMPVSGPAVAKFEAVAPSFWYGRVKWPRLETWPSYTSLAGPARGSVIWTQTLSPVRAGLSADGTTVCAEKQTPATTETERPRSTLSLTNLASGRVQKVLDVTFSDFAITTINAECSLSVNGAVAVFSTRSPAPSAGDTDNDDDVFSYDATTATLTNLSAAAPGSATSVAISGDGRWVAYAARTASGVTDTITVLDRSTGAALTHEPGGYVRVGLQAFSADGRSLAYVKVLSPGANDGDAYLYDRTTGLSRLLVPGVLGEPAISADGLSVTASVGGTPYTLQRVALATGAQRQLLSGAEPFSTPSVSSDGRYVAFSSADAKLSPGDRNGVADVFRLDTATDTLTRLTGGLGDSTNVALSGQGNRVLFISRADYCGLDRCVAGANLWEAED